MEHLIVKYTEKFLICGDLHGEIDTMRRILDYADKQGLTCIFVGDYVDSFTRTDEEMLQCLKLVQELQHTHIFLKGNHELSYERSEWRCTGWSETRQKLFQPIINSINWYNYFIIDDILITHAGLSNTFYQSHKQKDESVEDFIIRECNNVKSDIYKAGYISGGRIPVGGIFWCRPEKLTPLKGYTQIFGHTLMKKIVYYPDKNAYCIDNLYGYGKGEILVFNTENNSKKPLTIPSIYFNGKINN